MATDESKRPPQTTAEADEPDEWCVDCDALLSLTDVAMQGQAHLQHGLRG